MLDTNWMKLYEAAILEINPDNLLTRIGAAEQAIAQRESLVDITELERRKLKYARSMLRSLTRIASSQGKRAAYDAELQPGQLERLGSEASRSWLWRCGDLHPASNCAGTFFPVALVKIITAHSKGIARDGTHR